MKRKKTRTYLGEIDGYNIDDISLTDLVNKISDICISNNVKPEVALLNYNFGGEYNSGTLEVYYIQTESDEDFKARKEKVAQASRRRKATILAKKVLIKLEVGKMTDEEMRNELERLRLEGVK